MKTKIKTDKTFDAVQMMRDIRDKIDKELEGKAGVIVDSATGVAETIGDSYINNATSVAETIEDRKERMKTLGKENAYKELLIQIKQQIEAHKSRAASALNLTMMQLYYQIGSSIVEKQDLNEWGKSIVDQLSKDLAMELGSSTSYSSRNLWYMRQYYLAYSANKELRELSFQVPWGQNILILTKVKQEEERHYYLQQTTEAAWSRKTLQNAIKGDSFQHHKAADKQTNFKQTLPAHLSEQADEILKSEYALNFLNIDGPILERQLENRLIAQIKDFILELGYGFTYIGNQYKLSLRDKDYFVDLMFFHRKLKCLVAIDLKIGDFEPEFTGKMNFYLNLLNEQVKLPEENPSIGIILCAEKDRIEVEYALGSIENPIGVAEYKLSKKLPRELKGELPGVKELKAKIQEIKK